MVFPRDPNANKPTPGFETPRSNLGIYRGLGVPDDYSYQWSKEQEKQRRDEAFLTRLNPLLLRKSQPQTVESLSPEEGVFKPFQKYHPTTKELNALEQVGLLKDPNTEQPFYPLTKEYRQQTADPLKAATIPLGMVIEGFEVGADIAVNRTERAYKSQQESVRGIIPDFMQTPWAKDDTETRDSQDEDFEKR